MDWDTRYRQQARWTRGLRSYLFERTGLNAATRVLEVGCGTGALLQELAWRPGPTFGVDLNWEALRQCLTDAPTAQLLNADAHGLPFADGVFEGAFCHYLLLWVRDPSAALQEMRRVVRPGGYVLAIAEPDYLQREDQPPTLRGAGMMQTRSLQMQGADVAIGSRLRELFTDAGIKIVEAGPLLPHSNLTQDPIEQDLEWTVMQSDLATVLPLGQIEQYRQLDAEARRDGTRHTYVPTYFAWGQV